MARDSIPHIEPPTFSHPKERTQWDTLYSRRVCLPFPNCPEPWTTGAHSPRANIKGEMGFGAIIAKKGVSNAKRVHSKSCISGSQG